MARQVAALVLAFVACVSLGVSLAAFELPGSKLTTVETATADTTTTGAVASEPSTTTQPDQVEVDWAMPEVLPFFDDRNVSMVATSLLPIVAAYNDPADADPVEWFQTPTQFGGPRVFLVTDIEDDWVEVYLPVRPNGRKGWVRRSEVELEGNQYRAEVDLTTATVSAWKGTELIHTATVAHGRADRPTPLGRFYLRDIIVKENDTGVFGSHILALSGFSEVLETFGNGLPAVALHGTNQPELLGAQVSSGCIRLDNSDIQALAAALPLGTPVDIVASGADPLPTHLVQP